MTSSRWFRGGLTGLLFSLLATLSARGETPKPDATKKDDKAGIEFFEKKIRPMLVQHCYECHAADSKKIKGGLLLDTRDGVRKGGESGAAVVPGKVGDSLLIEALRHEGLEMPPKQKLP